MNKKTKSIILILLILVATVFTIYFRRGKEDIIPVKVATVKVGDVKSYLNTSGIIKSLNEKSYYLAQFKVNSINYKVGDVVKVGKTLLEYDCSEVEIALKQATSQYENAVQEKEALVRQIENIEIAKAELDKGIKEIDNAISEKEDIGLFDKVRMAISLNENLEYSMDEVIKEREKLIQKRESLPTIGEEEMKILNSRVEAAKSALEIAKIKGKNVSGKIISDIDGVVTAVNVQEGAFGNPAMPVIQVQDLNSLKIVVSLSKNDAIAVKESQPFEVTYGKSKYKGKISHVSPVAKMAIKDGGSSLLVEGIIENSDSALKVDFDAEVSILLDEKHDVKAIPTEAIKAERGKIYKVFVVEDGVAKEKEVFLGVQGEESVEIVSGLEEGEKVILNPTSNISDGVKVSDSNDKG